MSRLRQLNSQNYNTSGQINTEFESVVRYLNAAEFGNKTLSELLDIIFTEAGEFDANVEFRFDAATGLQYRAGTYDDAETGWATIVQIDDIRGAAGSDVGNVGEPLFDSRFEFTATGGETEVDIAHEATTILLVYKNGVLMREGGSDDYTADVNGGTFSTGSITFNVALIAADEVSFFKLEPSANLAVARSDFTTVGSQSNFAFVQQAGDSIQVYLNGLLQREGGGQDYIRDVANDLVIFNVAVTTGNDVTIVGASQSGDVTISGLMLESRYTDSNGFIPYSNLAFADEELPQAKIAQLVATLATTPDFEAAATEPPSTPRFWLDTSTTPNQLKFYDGSQYLSANPASQIPSFSVTDALSVLQVDATGTALEFGSVDTSSLVPKTQKGAANGVASLDTNARIPVAQLPEYIAYESYNFFEPAQGSGNSSERLHRFFRQQVEITAIAARCDSNSCDIQLEVDGVPTGSVYAVSTSANEVTLGSPITVDASTSSKLIGFAITNNASGMTNLDVMITVRIKSQ